MFPGEKHQLLSADSVEFDDPAMNNHQPYSMEFLNSLVSGSLPIMLLRNLDPSKGLCNGTRLRVISADPKFASHVLSVLYPPPLIPPRSRQNARNPGGSKQNGRNLVGLQVNSNLSLSIKKKY